MQQPEGCLKPGEEHLASKLEKDILTIIAIHVDGLMIIAKNILEMQRLANSFKVQFKMKDNYGELYYYMGVALFKTTKGSKATFIEGTTLKRCSSFLGKQKQNRCPHLLI